VDRIDVGDLGRGDDGGDVQVTLRRRPGTDAHLPVGQVQVFGTAVGLGIDGDRLDVQLPCGTDDPQGDFTAIGYENA